MSFRVPESYLRALNQRYGRPGVATAAQVVQHLDTVVTAAMLEVLSELETAD